MSERNGKIIYPSDLNIWPHEHQMAKRLAALGHTIEFLRPSNRPHQTTPDIRIDGTEWEMKSPRASSLKAIERNLKLASWQSGNIIFTATRMKNVPDKAVIRELTRQCSRIDRIKALKFITRRGALIDIG